MMKQLKNINNILHYSEITSVMVNFEGPQSYYVGAPISCKQPIKAIAGKARQHAFKNVYF